MAYVVQAITTKFIGPTNTRPARIKARAAAGSVMVPYDHGLSIERNHAAAAMAFLTKFKWAGDWHQGGMPDDCGYVFVCVAFKPAINSDHHGNAALGD